ncbi:MAG: TadE/TadG family type IV pilus assembly protein [Actinomycetota bacterium]
MGDHGQATVELALVTPLLVLLLLTIVQVGVVTRDQVLVVHAARAGARAAAVEPESRVAVEAAHGAGQLDPARMSVDLVATAGEVRVTVRYRAPTNVPLVGSMVGEVELQASAVFRREG